MLVCIECNETLMEVPLFNNAQDDDFPPSFLFCPAPKCSRHGLLTVSFKNDEKKDKKDSDKKAK